MPRSTAIEQAIGLPLRLRKFEVRSVSEGEDAQGEALVTVECDGRAYRGSSVSTNIVESGVRAFLEVDQPHRARAAEVATSRPQRLAGRLGAM